MLTLISYSNLSDNNLTAIPSDLFSNAPALEVLNFTANRIEGVFPPGLGQLKQLRYLGLGNNRLSGPLSAELFTMDRLEILNLRRNNFTGFWPLLPTNVLPRLATIDISFNSMVGGTKWINSFTNLKTARLEGNCMNRTVVPPERLALTFEPQRRDCPGYLTPALDPTVSSAPTSTVPAVTEAAAGNDGPSVRLFNKDVPLGKLKLGLLIGVLVFLVITMILLGILVRRCYSRRKKSRNSVGSGGDHEVNSQSGWYRGKRRMSTAPLISSTSAPTSPTSPGDGSDSRWMGMFSRQAGGAAVVKNSGKRSRMEPVRATAKPFADEAQRPLSWSVMLEAAQDRAQEYTRLAAAQAALQSQRGYRESIPGGKIMEMDDDLTPTETEVSVLVRDETNDFEADIGTASSSPTVTFSSNSVFRHANIPQPHPPSLTFSELAHLSESLEERLVRGERPASLPAKLPTPTRVESAGSADTLPDTDVAAAMSAAIPSYAAEAPSDLTLPRYHGHPPRHRSAFFHPPASNLALQPRPPGALREGIAAGVVPKFAAPSSLALPASLNMAQWTRPGTRMTVRTENDEDVNADEEERAYSPDGSVAVTTSPILSAAPLQYHDKEQDPAAVAEEHQGSIPPQPLTMLGGEQQAHSESLSSRSLGTTFFKPPPPPSYPPPHASLSLPRMQPKREAETTYVPASQTLPRMPRPAVTENTPLAPNIAWPPPPPYPAGDVPVDGTRGRRGHQAEQWGVREVESWLKRRRFHESVIRVFVGKCGRNHS
ncbi:hypothetical protein HDU96_007764 [Phlyctochytrium bullatum]|nr:hypothetical protein HDU96_007764 [Phlyctochytrium bullatum]